MASADSEKDPKCEVEEDSDEVQRTMLSDADSLQHELSNVNRKLEVMHLALEKARTDHNVAIKNKDNEIHSLQEKLDNVQEMMERLKYEKERLYSKGILRECDITEMKREIGKLKLQLEETESKARKREDVNAILMAQEKAIKEELREELKEEMDKNTHALHNDMVAILKEVQAEKKDVAAILQEIQAEKKDVAEVKRGMQKMANKGKYHKHCVEKAYH